MSNGQNKIPRQSFYLFLDSMIGKLFKIIKLKDNNVDTINTYISSLQIEFIGGMSLMHELKDDARLVSIISVLQYFIDNEYDFEVCKREVFKCIDIINKLKNKYE
jgi:hypothetical protein